MSTPIDPAGADIHGEARRLRAAYGPVARVTLPGGGDVHLVLGHAAARQLLRLDNGKVSADAVRHWDAYRAGLIPPGHVAHSWISTPNMFTADGERHTRLRKVIAPAFTPGRIASVQAEVERIAGNLLDRLDGREVVDLRAEFGEALPLAVLADWLGVPADARPGLHATVRTLFAPLRPDDVPAATARLAELARDLVDERRRRPGPDMTSHLLATSSAGEGLTESEVVETVFMVLGAGFETVTGLLDSAVCALVSPEGAVWAPAVRGGQPEAVEAVVTEVLRLRPPLAIRLVRAAVDDVALPLDGAAAPYRIRAGEGIVISYAGVGRDPEAYGPDADTFRPGRDGPALLSFGQGPHFCVGAALARLQARTALPMLLARFPRLRLAVPYEDLRPVPSPVQDDVRELPVRLS